MEDIFRSGIPERGPQREPGVLGILWCEGAVSEDQPGAGMARIAAEIPCFSFVIVGLYGT